MAKGTIQLISNEPEQLHIEYRSFERTYRKTRITFGVLLAVILVVVGILINQLVHAITDGEYNMAIISATMIPILILIGYKCTRSYSKSVTYHEQYKALRKATETLI